jgi:hypothetical protein
LRAQLCALAVALVGFACVTERPYVGTENELFVQATTRSKLVDRVGRAPRVCMHSRPGYEVCAWTLTRRVDPHWTEFAEAVGTGRAVGVICELPTAGGPRSADSCRIQARVALTYSDALRVSERMDVATPPSSSVRAQEARRVLDQAVSLRQLSFLVGDVPVECLRRSKVKQLCTWRLTSKMAGHRLVAATIGEDRKVTLACSLAYDGTPRGPDDCSVQLRR